MGSKASSLASLASRRQKTEKHPTCALASSTGVAVPEHDRVAVHVLPLAKHLGYDQPQLSPRRISRGVR